MEGKKAEASTEALPGEASPLPECERQGESCRSSEAPSVTASAEVLPLITAVVSASEEKERFCDSENNASLASAAPGCPACATYKDEDMAAWISLPNYIEASDRVMKDVKTPDWRRLPEDVLYVKKKKKKNDSGSDDYQEEEEEEDDKMQIDVCVLREHLKNEGRLSIQAAMRVLDDIQRVLHEEPNVLLLDAPVSIVGDVHGQFYDLLGILSAEFPEAAGERAAAEAAAKTSYTNKREGVPEPKQYLFLGDYVDRGCFGTEECSAKYNMEVYLKFMEVFDQLPIAAIINNKFLCLHGGLSPSVNSVAELYAIDRFAEPPTDGPLCDILWSDPADESLAVGLSDPDRDEWLGVAFEENPTRGCGFVFGWRAVDTFCRENDLVAIIRGHEVQRTGYCMHRFLIPESDRPLPITFTVFSAPNYCDIYRNVGAVMELYEDESYNFKTFECLPHPYWMPHFENAFDVSVHLMMKQILMWVKKNIIKVREEAAKRRRRSSLIVGDTEKFAYCTRTSSLSIPSSSSSVPPQGLHKADSPHTVHITVPTPCRSHSRSNGSSGASTPSSSGGAGSPVGSRRGNSSGSSGVGSRSGSKGASGRGSSGSSSPMSSPGSDGQCVVSDSEEITGSWSHKKQLRRRHSCEISHAVIDDSTRAKESVEDSSSKEGSPSISIDISVGESSGSGGGVAGSPTTTTITTTTTTTSSSSSSSYVKPVAAAASSGGGARKHGSLTGSSGSAGRASTMGRARTNGLKRSIDGSSSSSSSCSRSGSDINGSSSAKISIRGGTSLSTPGSPASPSSPSPSYTSTMVSMFSNINKQTQKYSNEDTMASVNVIPRGITTSRKNEFLEQQKRSMEYLHIPGLEMQQIQELLQGIRSKSKEQLLNKASAGYKREEVFDAARTYDQENERRPPVEELKKMFDSWAPTKYEFMYRDSNELAHTSSGYSLSTASSKFSFNIFQNTGAAASTTTSASASSSSQSQSTSTPIITVSATDVAQPQQQQQQQTITITTTTITTVPLSPPSSSMSPPPPPMAPSSSSSPVPTSSLLMHAPIPSPAVVPPVASPSSTLSTPSSSLSPPAPVPVVACSSPALPDGLPLAQVPPQVP